MRCHILEVHAGKTKKCKYCNERMRSSSIKRHMKYACIDRKRILKAKKEKKEEKNEQKENSMQCEWSHQSHRLGEDIFISSNDPFLAPVEPLNCSLNDNCIVEETEFDISEKAENLACS